MSRNLGNSDLTVTNRNRVRGKLRFFSVVTIFNWVDPERRMVIEFSPCWIHEHLKHRDASSNVILFWFKLEFQLKDRSIRIWCHIHLRTLSKWWRESCQWHESFSPRLSLLQFCLTEKRINWKRLASLCQSMQRLISELNFHFSSSGWTSVYFLFWKITCVMEKVSLNPSRRFIQVGEASDVALLIVAIIQTSFFNDVRGQDQICLIAR